MKRITIPANHVALIFKDRQLTQVLTNGKHWIGFGATVDLYDMSAPFLPGEELNVLLQHPDLAALLDVVEVADNEIALLYKDGNYRQVLSAGKFAFWKGATVYSTVKADLRTLYIDEQIDKNLIGKGALNPYVRSFGIDAFEQGILLVNGAMVNTLATSKKS